MTPGMDAGRSYIPFLFDFLMNLPVQQLTSNAGQDDAIDLAKYLRFIGANRWLIASCALVCMLLGAVYALTAAPVYESNILIQVEDGGGSTTNIPGEQQRDISDLKTRTASEMEILRSRLVLSRAVDNARLYISVQPKYFPGIGAWMARHRKQLSEPGLFGYGGYVWGGERAEVSIFNVPEDLEGAPFVLTVKGNDRFHLSQEARGIELSGRVGETIKVPAGNSDFELRVERLFAKPGAQFLLIRKDRSDTIEKLLNALLISEKGKQSGVIGVALQGPDPQVISHALNEIGREYIHQNEERRAEAAERALAFVNKQMPEVKKEMERSESKYNEIRNNLGTIDLAEESRTILQRAASIQAKMIDLEQRKEELLVRFQEESTPVEAINQQLRKLALEQERINEKIKRLPAIEQEVLRLTRDVKVNTELYTALLSAAQQLRVAASNRIGSVRLLDNAVIPNRPVKPRPVLIVALSAMTGIVLGVIAAFSRKTLSGRIDDPREVEQLLGRAVSATISHSKSQKQLFAQVQNREKKISLLPQEAPSDSAIESLHGFRAALQSVMLNASNNIVMITGPSPGVGKSFVSVNFAAVLASVGKKVLLIDSDIRTGHLHCYWGLERNNGLSDVIPNMTNLERVIHKDVVENVDFISTGSLPSKPAELLANKNFGRLLELFSARYDVVLIDTAPVLVVADALTIAAHAGAIFNIVRGGVTTANEIEETVKRFNQAGYPVTGTVFNDLKPAYSGYGYSSKYKKYRYVEEKYS